MKEDVGREVIMDLSIFLAQALGLYFLILGFAMVINGERAKDLIGKILKDDSLVFITGIIALIIGILLVLSHNIWVMGWPVVITILAWLALIKGIMRVVYPMKAMMIAEKVISSSKSYYTVSVIVFVIGLFLAYHGFFV